MFKEYDKKNLLSKSPKHNGFFEILGHFCKAMVPLYKDSTELRNAISESKHLAHRKLSKYESLLYDIIQSFYFSD